MKKFTVVIILLTLFFFAVPANAQSDNSYWEQLSAEGVNGTVYAIAIMGSNVYVGGNFTQAQGLPASNIAMWNGTTWSAVGTGTSGTVRALAVSGTDLYAGGDFTAAGGTTVNYIAKWNGASWSALGAGTNDTVRALAVNGSDLYVGGDFTNVDGTNIYSKSTAKWNGSSWSELYNIFVGGSATALAYFDSKLFIGSSNGTISSWDGSSWGNYSPVLGNSIFAITSTGNGEARYVGGAFDRYVSYYVDGDIGTLNGTVHSIIMVGSTMYAAGEFTQVDRDGVITTANHIAKYEGFPNFWSAVGDGVNGTIYALATDGTNIYAGGDFTAGTSGSKISHIGKLNGTTLSPLGTQNAINVEALAAHNGSLYAASGSTVKEIEGGSNWPTLGTSFSGGHGDISSLAVNGSDIYAGGNFDQAGSAYASCIAKWDGTAWSAVGDPYAFDAYSNDYIYTMAFEGNNLYVGGNFFGFSIILPNVAKWDGSNWSALGDGLDGVVYSLAVKDSTLYAGGDGFSGNISKWDGVSWSSLGAGMNGTVHALAFIGDELYAAGEFTTAGGNPANHIAKWDGTNWSALGTGVDGTVRTLAAAGTDIYIGGDFTAAGGITVNHIAKWDGANWSALGDGANDYVSSIAVTGNDLYAGGWFTTIGGVSATHIGHWFKPLAPAAVKKTFTTPQAAPLVFNDGGNTTGASVKITTASGGPTVTAFRYDDAPKDSSSVADDVSNYRWIIQQTGLASAFNAEVRFKLSEIPGNNISDPSLVTIYKRSTPGKGAFTPLATSYDNSTGELVASGISGFSELAFGIGEGELPVELVSFTAAAEAKGIELRWKTATEVNNYGFEIQRSEVGGQRSEVSWKKIGFVEGAGSSNSPRSYSFVDAVAQGKVIYRLKQIDNDGKFLYSKGVEVNAGNVPNKFALEQNYPNPFNPTTTIGFTLQASGLTTLKVHDVVGREVATLVNENLEAGVFHQKSFDASKLASGIYFARLQSGGKQLMKKMMLLK